MNSAIKRTKENGRDRLIASALTLFYEKGYHAVSVREICDRANANPSLISFHFGGKEALLELLFQELVTDQFIEIENTLIQVGSESEFKVRLKLFLERYVDFYIKHSEIVSIYLEELEREHPMAKEMLPETFGKLWIKINDFLKDAQNKKIIKDTIDTQILAYTIITPFICNMRSLKSSTRLHTGVLSDPNFKNKLINQIVDSIN